MFICTFLGRPLGTLPVSCAAAGIIVVVISEDRASALGRCIASLSSLEAVIAANLARMMSTNPAHVANVVAGELSARAARGCFRAVAEVRTQDADLRQQARDLMKSAAKLAERRDALVHSFYFQNLRAKQRRPTATDAEIVKTEALDPEELNSLATEAWTLRQAVVDLSVMIMEAG